MKFLRINPFIFIVFLVWPLRANDPYVMMEALLDSQYHPRLLYTLDVQDLGQQNPQPFLTLNGDFNSDGHVDTAISGIYDLSNNENKYFLLIATQWDRSQQPSQIFYLPSSKPIFIHPPGTTGEGDPGTQAFSISFCVDCEQGADVIWKKKQETFHVQPWTPKTKRTQKIVSSPSEEIPSDIIDRALQTAGNLKDVQIFIQGLKKSGETLGSRVEKEGTEPHAYAVLIFAKKKTQQILYDRIVVDINERKVIKRQLKIRPRKERNQ